MHVKEKEGKQIDSFINMLKAFTISTLGILVSVLTGHFFPSDLLFITPLYIPLLFLLVGLFAAKEHNVNLYIGFCFILILLNDLLFRFFGGGTHDDVGRAICELVFYITLLTTTVSLLCVKLIKSNKMKKLEPGGELTLKTVLLDILFIFSISAGSLILFYKFNRVI
jgi:hypothetical protein